MNISELIEELQEQLKEHGDLPVSVWADHGQHNELMCCIGPVWRDEDGETLADCDYEDEDEDFCKEDYTRVIEIS